MGTISRTADVVTPYIVIEDYGSPWLGVVLDDVRLNELILRLTLARRSRSFTPNPPRTAKPRLKLNQTTDLKSSQKTA